MAVFESAVWVLDSGVEVDGFNACARLWQFMKFNFSIHSRPRERWSLIGLWPGKELTGVNEGVICLHTSAIRSIFVLLAREAH